MLLFSNGMYKLGSRLWGGSDSAIVRPRPAEAEADAGALVAGAAAAGDAIGEAAGDAAGEAAGDAAGDGAGDDDDAGRAAVAIGAAAVGLATAGAEDGGVPGADGAHAAIRASPGPPASSRRNPRRDVGGIGPLLLDRVTDLPATSPDAPSIPYRRMNSDVRDRDLQVEVLLGLDLPLGHLLAGRPPDAWLDHVSKDA